MASDIDFSEQQELEEQERVKELKKEQLRWSRVAKKILGDPDIRELFDKIEAENLIAFKGLPLGATLEEYMVVHHDFLALSRFRSRLKDFVMAYEISEEQEEQDDGMEGVNI